VEAEQQYYFAGLGGGALSVVIWSGAAEAAKGPEGLERCALASVVPAVETTAKWEDYAVPN
jgi:hypothetical protein